MTRSTHGSITHRYAVTGTRAALPPTVYLAKAAEAVAKDPTGLRASALRYPEPGWPVRVVMRGQSREPGTRPQIVTVFLDPPTATVLDVMEFRSSFFGFLHVFHENLTIPEYSGRQIVGWAGVGMLIMSLTGLWPLVAAWKRFSARLPLDAFGSFHFQFASPAGILDINSAGGGFTHRHLPRFPADRARGDVVGGHDEPATATRRANSPAQALTADHAQETAMKAAPNAEPVALFLPVQQRGEAALSWRVQMTARGEPFNVMVDDQSGQVTVVSSQPGDRAASWIRWIHEGSHSGPVWGTIIFLTGVFPDHLCSYRHHHMAAQACRPQGARCQTWQPFITTSRVSWTVLE